MLWTGREARRASLEVLRSLRVSRISLGVIRISRHEAHVCQAMRHCLWVTHCSLEGLSHLPPRCCVSTGRQCAPPGDAAHLSRIRARLSRCPVFLVNCYASSQECAAPLPRCCSSPELLGILSEVPGSPIEMPRSSPELLRTSLAAMRTLRKCRAPSRIGCGSLPRFSGPRARHRASAVKS